MKSIVVRSARLFISCLLLSLLIHLGAAQNTKKCEPPSKGDVTCDSSQAASCDVDSDGTVHGQCTSASGNRQGDDLLAWYLTQILHEKISPKDVRRTKYETALREGRIVKGGSVITFSLPEVARSFIDHREETPTHPGVICEACVEAFGQSKCERFPSNDSKAQTAALEKLCGKNDACARKALSKAKCTAFQ